MTDIVSDTLGTYTSVLQGNTDKRGRSPFCPADQQYAGPIPAEEIRRRVFGWHAVEGTVDSTYTIPAVITEEGVTPEQTVTVSDETRKTIINPTNGQVLAVTKQGYVIHQYDETLIGGLSHLVGDTLQFEGAGLTQNGGVGWVAISAPDNIETPEGFTFRPNLMAATSLNKSISTTFRTIMHAPICQNQIGGLLWGKVQEGLKVAKIRHTAYSPQALKDAGKALGIIEHAADDFATEVSALCATKVTPRQLQHVLDVIIPVSEKRPAQAEAKHREVRAMWNHDPRVAMWTGTAFGVVQAFNTWTQHEQAVRTDRGQRNMDRAILGHVQRDDNRVIQVLRDVLV